MIFTRFPKNENFEIYTFPQRRHELKRVLTLKKAKTIPLRVKNVAFSLLLSPQQVRVCVPGRETSRMNLSGGEGSATLSDA